MGKTIAPTGLGMATTDAAGPGRGWREAGQAGGHAGQEGVSGSNRQGVMEEGPAAPRLRRLWRKMHFYLCIFGLYPCGLYIHLGVASTPLECQDEDGPHRHLF